MSVEANGPVATLYACSLVSRQWLPRTRHHIFRILALILASTGDSHDNAATFLRLLESPLTRVTLVPYVRTLSLKNYIFDGPGLLTPGELLGNLAHLGLRPTQLLISGSISQVTMTLLDDSSPSFADSVTSLKLVLNDEVPLDELAAYICAFRSLESLAVHCTGPNLLMSRPTSGFLSPALRSLRVNGSASSILDWISSALPDSVRLAKILVCSARSEEFWEHINQFLGKTVGVESLTFLECATGPEFYTGTSIPTLRSLGLEYRMNTFWRQVVLSYHSDPRFNDTTEVIPTIRAFAACAGVQTVKISVDFLEDAASSNQLPPWQLVDQALLETWPDLLHVVICRPDGLPIPATTARDLRTNLPLCEARGILGFRNVA
ncbi:hypothetical protein B0H19DRAFT_1262595 [Mycena capillaripes]|nr:hypothetical protein B0H19DRAFT_1262595 [Mycena capillaripes]